MRGWFGSSMTLAAALLASAAYGSPREENLNDPVVGEENAVLSDAPNVPPPIHRDHATKMIVHLEIKEVEGRLADGVRYTFWTFGGHVPGKFIRIREGDEVEMHDVRQALLRLDQDHAVHAVANVHGDRRGCAVIDEEPRVQRLEREHRAVARRRQRGGRAASRAIHRMQVDVVRVFVVGMIVEMPFLPPV